MDENLRDKRKGKKKGRKKEIRKDDSNRTLDTTCRLLEKLFFLS